VQPASVSPLDVEVSGEQTDDNSEDYKK